MTFHYDRATNAVWATVDGAVVAGAAPATGPDVEAEDPAAPEPASVSFPGTIGKALGGEDWTPGDASVQAAGEGNGVWALTGNLPAGEYEFKAAIDGGWDINYGLDGEPNGAEHPAGARQPTSTVTFRYDAITNAVWAEVAGQVVAGEAPAE